MTTNLSVTAIMMQSRPGGKAPRGLDLGSLPLSRLPWGPHQLWTPSANPGLGRRFLRQSQHVHQARRIAMSRMLVKNVRPS